MNTLKDKIVEMEKKELFDALRECNWVIAKAAKQLGITERMASYKIRKYGIRKEESQNKEVKREIKQNNCKQEFPAKSK